VRKKRKKEEEDRRNLIGLMSASATQGGHKSKKIEEGKNINSKCTL